MSSSYVRTEIKSFMATTFPGETLIDLTAEFENIRDFLAHNGITGRDAWLGLQFIGSDEQPINVGAGNTQGLYRETGSLFFHIVEPAVKSTAANNIVSRSETLRSGLRGMRINDIVIESVTPVTTQSGSTLEFESGFTSGSFIVSYYRDLNL